MKIKIICVGSLKDKYLQDGVEDYKKRIKKHSTFEIIEVGDEKNNGSSKELENALIKEGEKLLGKINSSDYVIALDVKGKSITSENFSKKIENLFINGESSIVFLIGGSMGYGKNVLERVNERISFGEVTLPHGLFRVVLCEQIYRAFKIMKNEPYHK